MWKNSADTVLISPSIIASDLSCMGNTVKSFDPAAVDLLHMDVMDGHFVPNLTFGPGYIRDLKNNTGIPLDVHLMIEKPENSVARYIELNPWCITIHYESTRFPVRVLAQIHEAGIKAGISLNPATPVEAVYDICSYADLVLVMSVDPGFYGQAFMPAALDRIRKLKNYLDGSKQAESVAIQVDGGISRTNIASAVQAGARIIVAGSAAFSGGDVNGNVRELKKIALASL